MKIAVPVKENHDIDNHFGHCAFYQIFTVNDQKEIVSTETMDSPVGCGCKSDIAEVFEQMGVQVMLAGGIGNGAITKISAHHIEVVRNCGGNATELVKRYLSGEVTDSGSSCQTHSHEEGYVCSHDH